MPNASQRLAYTVVEQSDTTGEYAPKESHPEGMPVSGPSVRQRYGCMLASRWDAY